MDAEIGSNFMYDIMEKDLAEGKVKEIRTRFPPEPNGYLHVGSAKAIFISYLAIKKYGGTFNLRYDDTNPLKEDDEYVKAIYNDLCWLGAVPDRVLYGSDYFDKCYEYAIQLIKKGKAFVCDLTADEMREYRGTLTTPGKNSPYRERSIEENLDLFIRMKNGEFPDKSRTLRAKIDMASPNMNMRDPAIYRILHAEHHRQGNKWCIYPMYDYAHPIQDAIEEITHSMCTLEFEDHRPLYDWVVDNIDFEKKPHQYEFAKLFMTYTIMGKRYLREMVETGVVDGWNDPRMPTLSGLRRRGYTPNALKNFIMRSGVSKVYSVADIRLLEHCMREDLSRTAPRRIAVLDPLPVVITNYPEGKSEKLLLNNNPEDENAGMREAEFSRRIFIDRSDFEENPPPKFFRLKPGGEVRLMGGYIIKCEEVVKDENGKVVELRCTYDPDTLGKNPADGRKVKGTVHWLSENNTKSAVIRMYDYLFTLENICELPDDKDYRDYINPDSLKVYENGLVEKNMNGTEENRFQFVRIGYFCSDSEIGGTYNLIVGLKDSYKGG